MASNDATIATFICVVVAVGGMQSPCSGNIENCVVGLCNIPVCSVCSNRGAVCNTQNASEPIPQSLSELTNTMTLNYEGKTAIQLTADMFNRYYLVNYLNISGNIFSIASKTFAAMNKALEKITISHTKIHSIAFDAFSDGARLRYLVLPFNQLSQVPYRLLGKIKRLYHIDLSYNPLQICDNTNKTIATQFSHLPYIDTVKLAGIGDKKCTGLPSEFFSPLSKIRTLDLSESKLLNGNSRILLPLKNLNALYVNNLEPYKTCPSKIAEVFKNLPPNISKLIARGWRSEMPLNQSCMVTNSTFSFLRGTKLSYIDFSESDWIVGEAFQKSIFDGFDSLRTLHLPWTRINSIEAEAFQNLPKLASLNLEGNQLGPRRFTLFKPGNISRLASLSLSNIGILHDKDKQYNAEHLLEGSPNLREIFIDGNRMTRVPIFSRGNRTFHGMIRLAFDDNRVSDLSPTEMSAVCDAMPNLSYISAQRNYIDDISGLCTTLEKLDLDDNDIGHREEDNLQAIKRLHRLHQLSLNRNGLQNLLPDLLQSMKNLSTFLASGNAIKTLPPSFFNSNPVLSHIDFSLNLIASLDVESFSFSTHLHHMLFYGNQLTTVPLAVRQKLDNISYLAVLDVSANPFDCSCNAEDRLGFQEWIRNSSFIANVKNLTCAGDDPHRNGSLVYRYTQDKLYCTYRIPLFVILAITVTLIVVTPMAVKLYKYRWYVCNPRVVARAISSSLKEVKNEQHCTFDAVVSYDKDSNDINFIQQFLIPHIEGNEMGVDDIADNSLEPEIMDQDTPSNKQVK